MSAHPPNSSDASDGPCLRVLCVDDNPDIADSEVMLLRITGFEARACYCGPSAVAAVREFRPAACLIDLNMPGMDGDEVAARIRDLPGGGAVVLVAVTAAEDEASRDRLVRAGFQLILTKPVNPHDLLRVLDEISASASRAGSGAVAAPR